MCVIVGIDADGERRAAEMRVQLNLEWKVSSKV